MNLDEFLRVHVCNEQLTTTTGLQARIGAVLRNAPGDRVDQLAAALAFAIPDLEL